MNDAITMHGQDIAEVLQYDQARGQALIITTDVTLAWVNLRDVQVIVR